MNARFVQAKAAHTCRLSASLIVANLLCVKRWGRGQRIAECVDTAEATSVRTRGRERSPQVGWEAAKSVHLTARATVSQRAIQSDHGQRHAWAQSPTRKDLWHTSEGEPVCIHPKSNPVTRLDMPQTNNDTCARAKCG